MTSREDFEKHINEMCPYKLYSDVINKISKEIKMTKLIEYVAAAVRYATIETGLKDWSNFSVIVNEFELGEKEIIGMPVLIAPMRAFSGYTFCLIYPWGIDNIREKALKKVLEFQELYTIDNFETVVINKISKESAQMYEEKEKK
jgi:hypothetical protein